MSGKRPAARFRIRLEDGSEVPVASQEALARRIERHDVLPDTPLYDASTDAWGPAGHSSMVRFILEEMERDGYLLPEGWAEALAEPLPAGGHDDAGPPAPDPSSTPPMEGPGEEGGPEDASVEPSLKDEGLRVPADAPGDPGDDGGFPDFEVAVEPADDSDLSGAASKEADDRDAGEGKDAPPDDPSPEEEREDEDLAAALDEFTLAPEAASPEEDADPSDPVPDRIEESAAEFEAPADEPEQPEEIAGPDDAAWPTDDPASERPASWDSLATEPFSPRFDYEESESDPAGSGDEAGFDHPAHDPPEPVSSRRASDPWGHEVRESASSEASAEVEIADPEPVRTRRRRVPLLLLALAAAVGLFLDRMTGEWLPGVSGPRPLSGPASVVEPGSDVPPPPPEIEGVTGAALAAVAQRFDGAVDSVRVAAGVPGTVPAEWLGGYYLANASEFPEVPEFWDGYADLVNVLGNEDRALFESAVAQVAGAVPGADGPQLAAYLRTRYVNVEPDRQQRYSELARAAHLALELHTFLEANEEALAHTPAVGGVVPEDPVLEVGTTDPELRQELNRRLDNFLDALYRARDGAAPSPEGIRVELFEGFSRF